ncbi:EthD family reductase [Nocardioides marmoriginsengisoli]|uniref:EthD family reductase n=1 Tax=Nocardioides marmoriginsengisoli TaxID=661483 RepID=A0A3N0CG93_9ACTN|nr:EthD domain-containing protein [Nocardioides marmoriginsengisoli]RNL62455.1 EthD family reductase [Nocardioides marmoriginsengisoli]
MIKMRFGWRDRPGMTAEECEAHYRSVHMELARAGFDGVDGFIAVAYERVRSAAVNDFNRPERREVVPDFDAFCELYFRDATSMQAAFARPQLAAMFEDHVNFMDTEIESNVRIYEVEETVFFGARPDPTSSASQSERTVP